MTRVLLLHPGIYESDNPLAFPPWGAINVASSLRLAGHDVSVADLNGAEIGPALANLTQSFAPDVVGLTAKLGQGARRMRRIVDWLESNNPDTLVAVGGPLVSTFPDPSDPLWWGVDALFPGDGEATLASWLATNPRRGAVHLAERVEADLDNLGVPTWWQELHNYVHPARSWPGMNVPAIHVAVARGCTRRCTFCYLNQHYPGTRFRQVSPSVLFDGLVGISEAIGAKGFYFVDDCFIDRPAKNVFDFVNLNRAAGSPFRFGCDIQLEDLENVDLLAAMHEAGFRSFYLGVEASSEAVRAQLAKSRVKVPVSDLLRRANDMGFVIRASIGIGWPGESEADMHATLDLIDSVPALAFDAYKYFPIPGVPLTVRRFGRTNTRNTLENHPAFEDFSEFNANYSGLSDESFEEVWSELLRRSHERLSAYHVTQGT